MFNNQSLEKKRWYILSIICLINLCAGSIYAWSVLSAAAAESLSASTGTVITASDLAIAFGVANSVGPVPMIFGGAFNDKYGPRLVIMTGGLLIGLGLCGCGLASSVMEITVAYGLVFGLGLGLTYGAGISTAVKYFPDRRGLAGGLVTAAYGFSSVLVPPIAQSLTERIGIMQTFIFLGIAFGAVIMTGSIFCQRCPDNFLPNGTKINTHSTPKGQTWREMLTSPIFYPMIALLMCGAISGMMILSQAASIAKNEIGMGLAAATGAVSTIALFNMAGRLAAGFLSDSLGRIGVLLAALACSAIGLFVLMNSTHGDTVMFYFGCVLIGMSFGAFMAIYPGFTTDQFGAQHAGVNYGIMFSGFSLAGLLGPILMQYMQSLGFTFAQCCMAGIAFCGLGGVFAFIYKGLAK